MPRLKMPGILTAGIRKKFRAKRKGTKWSAIIIVTIEAPGYSTILFPAGKRATEYAYRFWFYIKYSDLAVNSNHFKRLY